MKPGLLPLLHYAFTVAEVSTSEQEGGKREKGRSSLYM